MNEQGIGPVNESRPVIKGSVVRYKDGWMRVRAAFKDTVNLGSIFGSKTIHKSVPRSEVYEDEGEWYRHWQESETYQSM